MRSLTSYITLAALLLHFTLGLGEHAACAAPEADCAHAEHEHQEESQSAPGDSTPDGRACLELECGVILPAPVSLAVVEQATTLDMAAFQEASPGGLPVGARFYRSREVSVAPPLRTHLVYQLLLI